jgi:hypothetical protein
MSLVRLSQAEFGSRIPSPGLCAQTQVRMCPSPYVLGHGGKFMAQALLPGLSLDQGLSPDRGLSQTLWPRPHFPVHPSIVVCPKIYGPGLTSRSIPRSWSVPKFMAQASLPVHPSIVVCPKIYGPGLTSGPSLDQGLSLDRGLSQTLWPRPHFRSIPRSRPVP